MSHNFILLTSLKFLTFARGRLAPGTALSNDRFVHGVPVHCEAALIVQQLQSMSSSSALISGDRIELGSDTFLKAPSGNPQSPIRLRPPQPRLDSCPPARWT